jgi:hypothetical protein
VRRIGPTIVFVKLTTIVDPERPGDGTERLSASGLQAVEDTAALILGLGIPERGSRGARYQAR